MTDRTLRAEVVVLRHSDWGEADRRLVLYSREAGKLIAVAKGARKLRSRKAGHLEPFTRVRLLLARGRDMWIVTQAETVEAYLPLREDLVRTAYAAYALELVDRFTYEEGANRMVFALLVDALEHFSTFSDPFLAARYFDLHLLDPLGFRPELFHCVGCGAEIRAEDQYFSLLNGGVLCPRCGEGLPSARAVSREALRFLRHYQRSNFAEAVRLDAPTEIRSEVEGLLRDYQTYLLERQLNSSHFLQEMRAAYRPE